MRVDLTARSRSFAFGMASLGLLASLAGHAGAEPDRTYITIGSDAAATAASVTSTEPTVLGTSNDVIALEVATSDLETLSQYMHEQHHRCAGFMAHDTREEALAALEATPATRDVDYTIDQPEVVRALLPAVDPARILGTIAELSAMKNRYYRSESGAAASRWLRDRWRSFTDRPDVTVELFDHGYPQQSVIMTIPGTTRANEIVVIGGHLDSIAFGGERSNAPGADDDASGIATLTEVARVVLASDFRPARTLQFIAYAAEEVGLRGSLSIVKDYKRRGVDVVGVLQLDMTNYQGSDKDIWLINDFTSAPQNVFLGALIDTYVGASWGFDACGYACSDHAAWHRGGFRASMPFESRSNQRNRHIHTARDTLEISDNNAAHAVKFARLATAYAVELAKGELAGARLATPTTCPRAGAPASHGSRAVSWQLLGALAALALAFAITRRM
jgi:bacterial leucyl aminopeptidase